MNRLTAVFKAFNSICFCLIFSTIVQAQTLDRIAARINDEIITSHELDEECKLLSFRLQENQVRLPEQAVFRQQVLDKLVTDKLQMQRAEMQHITVEPQLVDESLKAFAESQDKTLDELRQRYADAGIAFSQLQHAIKRDLIVSRLQHKEIDPLIHVSPLEISQSLRSQALQDASGAEYRLGHILISLPSHPSKALLEKTRLKAQKLLKSLQQGASFKELALAHSETPQALEGGDLGWRKLTEIPTLFVKYVPSMQVGELVGPIASPSGFHLIKLIDKRARELKQEPELHVRQILIKTGPKRSDAEAEKLLNRYRAQIEAGQDFAQIAQSHSEEISTSYKGGDLGWIRAQQVLPEFYQVIQKLPIKHISAPFKTALGWHVTQVLERRTTETSSEALQRQAQMFVYQQKFEDNLRTWLRHLKENADIKIMI